MKGTGTEVEKLTWDLCCSNFALSAIDVIRTKIEQKGVSQTCVGMCRNLIGA